MTAQKPIRIQFRFNFWWQCKGNKFPRKQAYFGSYNKFMIMEHQMNKSEKWLNIIYFKYSSLTITDRVKQENWLTIMITEPFWGNLNGYGRMMNALISNSIILFLVSVIFEVVKLWNILYYYDWKRLSTFHIELLLLSSGNGMQAIDNRWYLIKNKTNPMGIFWRVSSQ